MQTTKKRRADFTVRQDLRGGSAAAAPRHTRLALALSLAVFLAGCMPPGPRALLEGKQHLDRAEYAEAVEELRSATQLMPTNALAFNYLGLALHHAGQSAEAERAYLRALALDHDLSEIHYDLGCLWLSQSNRLDQAKYELTAYTLRRPTVAEGWLKLGQAQLRARELTAAEHSLEEAVRLEPHNPETLTELGVLRYQRRRPNEAAPLFAKALQERADYAPALLNSAILAQEQNDPRLALERYREYAALKPPPEDVSAVAALMQQLQQQLNPPQPRELLTNRPAPPATTITNPPKPAVPEAAHPVTQAKPPATNTTHTPPPGRPEPATNLTRTTAPPARVVATNAPPETEMQVVHLPAEPTIKPAQDGIGSSVPARRAEPEAQEQSQTSSSPAANTKPPKRGFFQRINPINLFAHDGTAASGSAPPVTTNSGPVVVASGPNARGAEARTFPRYAYLSPMKPITGDRGAAEPAFAQGVKLQEARRFADAVQSYRRAVQADPAFYDAQYNLALAAAESGSVPLALAAYETALALKPDSLDARYNFGLVLKQAGYAPDAVAQFEKILALYPNDARTHLALGNLYAQQFHDTAKARQQYQAVLAVAPQSPQAGAIVYWLSDHPR
jgi:Flp pilus assembly protein TadD